MKTLKILVIDDEDWVRIALKELLKGHELVAASDGREGLKEFSQKKFDVVFVDRKMPGMLGEEVTRKIKLSSPNTKVIFMSSAEPGFAFMLAKAAGADRFLDKYNLFAETNFLIRELFPAAIPP